MITRVKHEQNGTPQESALGRIALLLVYLLLLLFEIFGDHFFTYP